VRAPRRHLAAGAAGGLAAAVALLLLEVAVIGLAWREAFIPPHDLARSRMYDFATELYGMLQRRLGATWLGPAAPGIYLPGWSGLGALLRDLAAPVLAAGLLLGGLAGVAGAARGTTPSARTAALVTLAVGALADTVLWLASTHVPAHPTVVRVLRNAVFGLTLDGAWVSLASAAGAAALVLAGGRMLARVPLGASARRLVAAAALGAVALFGVAAHGRSGARADVGGAVPAPRPVAGAPGDRPNVILISIDSLRADHLGCYGYPKPTSPRIDALAASGVRFDTVWSTTSWTLPAHVSMLTGRTLLAHGVREFRDTIPPSVPLLAELLRRAGYATAGVVAAPFLSARYGFARGFEHYDETAMSGSHAASWRGATSPKTHAAATAWLRDRNRRREPFFLFVHYWDVHYDYDPPPPYDTMFDPSYRGALSRVDFISNPAIHPGMDRRDLEHVLALYDGEIRYTDEHVGRLLDLVDELGLRERTIVVLAADHGEEFFEHGRKGHERTLYEEVLRVPLVVSWPGRIAPGQVVGTPVGIVDVAPTILDLAGVPAPPDLDGRPLVGVQGRPRAAGRLLVAELYRQSMLNFQIAVRDGSDKFIQALKAPRVEFYDLAHDPREAVRTALDADRRDRLRARAAEFVAATWARTPGGRDGGPVVLDAERLKALRALGYIE